MTELELRFIMSSWGREAQLLFSVKQKHSGMVELKLALEFKHAIVRNVLPLFALLCSVLLHTMAASYKALFRRSRTRPCP